MNAAIVDAIRTKRRLRFACIDVAKIQRRVVLDGRFDRAGPHDQRDDSAMAKVCCRR